MPADVNTAATAPIYAARPFKSVAIVWLYITSTISSTAGTNSSIKPIIVTKIDWSDKCPVDMPVRKVSRKIGK